MPPPDMAVEPPMRAVFSRTSTSNPRARAPSAPQRAPPPLPTITASVVASQSITSLLARINPG